MKQISFKTPLTAAELFDSLYAVAVALNPILTKGSFFEQVVTAYSLPKVATDTAMASVHELDKLIVEELKGTIKSLEAENDDCLELSRQELNFVIALRTTLDIATDADRDAIIQAIRATQQRAMTALTEQAPLMENEILFTIPDIHLKLLNETTKRLSIKYGFTVTIKDVLLDMFARYTIEQLNQWFYPFVIKGDADFTAITGHTQKQLQQWLSKEKAV